MNLIANSGIQFYTKQIEVNLNDNFKMCFHEWLDVEDQLLKMEIAHNFSEDEVWVRKVGGASENFEKYEVTDASTIIEPMNLTSAEVAEDSIDGRGLEMMSGNTNQKYVLSKIDVKNFKFEKGYTYNITFDFRNLGQVGNGGYFFIANGDYNNVRTDYTVFGEWYERADNWDTKKTFSFTPTEDKY